MRRCSKCKGIIGLVYPEDRDKLNQKIKFLRVTKESLRQNLCLSCFKKEIGGN